MIRTPLGGAFEDHIGMWCVELRLVVASALIMSWMSLAVLQTISLFRGLRQRTDVCVVVSFMGTCLCVVALLSSVPRVQSALVVHDVGGEWSGDAFYVILFPVGVKPDAAVSERTISGFVQEVAHSVLQGAGLGIEGSMCSLAVCVFVAEVESLDWLPTL